MASSEIDRLIWLKRCSSYASFVPLVLYLPIGLALGVLRFFIFLHACLLSYLLPNGFPFKRLMLRVMLAVTGLPISTQGVPSNDCKKKVVIANHVSNLDPFILALLNPLILTLEAPSPQLASAKGKLTTYDIPGDRDHSDTINVVKNKMTECEEPLLFFPERLKTNGRSGILKFSMLPFELDCPIQPVTIQAYRYLFDIRVSTHSSTLFEDIAWCFLTPLTLFKIRYLPVTEKKRDESKEEFVVRVQQNMAKSMGLSASQFTHHDVIEHIKSVTTKERVPPPRIEPQKSPELTMTASPQPPQPTLTSSDAELTKMVKQVKDVLPDIPSQCILSDLRKTKDVDATIANILDGRIDPSQWKDTPEKPMISLSQGLSFKASNFENNARARQMSFQERKQAMLEAARLKYRTKHGL
ncbi:ancient ubiquitous protein 1 [Aplysia californica]|uniref:Lipid droplet-regulating VLDL assembly factor AUP1 n=1 Tax=Aplysia californica TaxID=6500 RepID=A0ABM1A7V8_APLCA|nr:ancient ubiquitous protein 1 [Aplysia californica]